MPKVGQKHFAYSKKGKAAARRYKKQQAKKNKHFPGGKKKSEGHNPGLPGSAVHATPRVQGGTKGGF